MRRLARLVSVLVLVDTMLYAALTPLLGSFARHLHLSEAAAGTLVAAYAAGALIGGLPGGVASARLGPRRAVLSGLTMMGIASLSFAWSDSFWTLAAARLVQGAGSAFTWAGAFSWLMAIAPREQRGEVIGTAMGAAVFGALFGPALGALASLAGRGPVFSAVALLAVVLAALTVRIETRPPEQPSLAALRRALSPGAFTAGLLLLGLGSVLFGVLDVLVPLHLSGAGWGAGAVGAVFLAGAALEMAQSRFIGRLSDRRGALTPVRYALAGGAAVSLALALVLGAAPYAGLVVLASLLYGALFTPAFALIVEGAEQSGLVQGLAFGVMNAAWAVGAMGGPLLGGAVADLTGQRVPFVLAALACAASLLLVRRARLRGTGPALEAPAYRAEDDAAAAV